MVLYCCKCLNVKINTFYRTEKEREKDKLKKADHVFTKGSTAFETTLGLGGIAIEHDKLLFISYNGKYIEFRCDNCQFEVFAVINTGEEEEEEEVGQQKQSSMISESQRDHIISKLKDQTGSIILNVDCLSGDEIKNVKSDKNFSEVFKILINEDLGNKKLSTEVDKTYQEHLMSLHMTVTDAFAAKQKELKEKVRKYEEQLTMELNQQQAKAHMDRQKLWNTICFLNKDSLNSRSRSSSKRSQETVNEPFVEPSSSSIDTISPKMAVQMPKKEPTINKIPLSLAVAASSSSSSPLKIKDEKPKEKEPIIGSLKKKDNIGVFGMDGFDEEEEEESTNQSESEEEEEEETPETNQQQPEMSIYSSSLPIAIPPRIAIVQSDDQEENLPFEAPHQIAARTYTEDRTEIFGERPNRRVGFSFGL